MLKFVRRHNIVEAPGIPAGLRDELSFNRREFDPGAGRRGGGRGNGFKIERVRLVTDAGEFPLGLLERAAAWCRRNGVAHEIEHAASPRDLELDISRIDEIRSGQEDLLAAIGANDGGLIVGGTGLGKSWVITQVCKMYPDARIVVCSPRVSVVKTIYERLKPLLGSEVALYCTGSDGGGRARVELSTVRSLIKTGVQNCDILLFDEAHAVGCNQTADLVGMAAVARRFGFTATPRGRSDGGDMVMEALFGPIRAEIPYDEAQAKGLVVPIEVEMLEWDSSAVDTTRYGMQVARKRWGYWRNKGRNRLIAAAARLVPEDEQVLIMVETLEHAIYLHNELPEFTVVHYGNVDKGAVTGGRSQDDYKLSSRQTDELRRSFESGELKRAIATTVWKEGVRGLSAVCW